MKAVLALIISTVFLASIACGGGSGEKDAIGEEVTSKKIVVCNFHGHAVSNGNVGDSGHVTLADQLTKYKDAGYDFFYWTPHSDTATEDAVSMTEYKALSASFPQTGTDISCLLGLELTVKNGPNFTTIMGYSNNNHLSIFGISKPIPHKLPYRAGIELAHAMEGFAIINHPGPGPAEWELDYFTRPDLLKLADGIECFNGQLAEIGIFEANDYRWSVANGAMLFAAANTDAHQSDSPLHCATIAFADSKSTTDVYEALRNRQTVALYNMTSNPPLAVAKLGEIITGETKLLLSISFANDVDSISLYKDEDLVNTWTDTKSV